MEEGHKVIGDATFILPSKGDIKVELTILQQVPFADSLWSSEPYTTIVFTY